MKLYTRRRRFGGGSVGGAPAVTVVTDTFTRADDVTSLGSTEGGTAGALAWTQSPAAQFGILSNVAYPSSAVAFNVAYVNSGVADCTVSVVISAGVNYAGLIFRAADGSNYWSLIWNPDAPGFRLRKCTAGAQSLIAAHTATAVAGDTLSVVLSGTSIICKQNGTVLSTLTTTDSYQQTSTRHGITLEAGASGIRWDNFLVTVP